MKRDKKVVWLFVLSIMGTLFSGYLSGVKLFTKTCAFNESCPYFLGYPACYFGFAMFFTLLILSTLLFVNRDSAKGLAKSILGVSFLGILFAGYYTLGELPLLFKEGFGAYILGLPTCAMGFIFYVLVFLICTIFLKRMRMLESDNATKQDYRG